MITDNQTKLVYLSDRLPKQHPDFFAQFSKVLSDCNINYAIIQGTKDIWAVDYMPVQIEKDKFVQFVYNPDYLQTKSGLKLISNADSICRSIAVNTLKSNIVLDGGNVIRSKNKVIMCDKVFQENKSLAPKQLIKQLESLFEVDQIIFVPQQPNDFTGHADGMVRFLDDDTVIVNDYGTEKDYFKRAFFIAFHNAGLHCIEIPYNPYRNRKHSQANGIYINYLQMKNVVIVPTFGIEEDDVVVKQFGQLFYGQKIATFSSNEIADKGGVLNCITWNIAV